MIYQFQSFSGRNISHTLAVQRSLCLHIEILLFDRLTEIGPRMTLQLLKIEDGIANGEVLYHSVIHKTPEEIEQLKELREKKRYGANFLFCNCNFVFIN